MNPLAAALTESGFRPKRSLGQNFLFDENFLDLMVRESALGATDTVVEFGTGPGQLTERLASRAARVVTVEIDPRLHAFAKGRLRNENIDFVLGDAIPGGDLLSDELAARARGPVRVVSNFPYAVGGSILLALAERQLEARDAVGTLQWEVAERLAAKPSTEPYGPLGILITRLADVEILRKVPPQVFWPRPEVDSALVRVTFGARPFEGDWEGYKAFVKAVFSQRRKTLGAGLKKMGHAYGGQHAARRPEELTPAELEEVWRGTRAKA